ncbi:TonB-dependent receptor [Hyphomicrobium sp. ghe19]|uniref:TonB-dependent receptor n=1 Tax=Hyphomicrobium sp. ghe19 TaxID=2682968 RepID=UPI0013669CE2|nr:Vitamin B12 transporter BtuB [Hyphomicrobium sp. ghe19]
MKYSTFALATVVALGATAKTAGPAIAQDAGGAAPPTTAPAPSTSTPAPSGGATTPGTTLPEVQIIQQKKPKPAPTKQVTKAPKKAKPSATEQVSKPPAKKPAPVAAAVAPPPAAPPPSGPPPVEPPPAVESDTEGVSQGVPYEVAPGPSTVKMSPISGSEIPIEKVPGGVSTISAGEIARLKADYVPDALAHYVPGVILSDVQGNVFQNNVDYRGFTSSPVDGVPQGLAVYQNGVRINEAFGDTVNYDFLPAIAISSITVMSGNPVYGLNAIGGALTFDMKDGFTYQGLETDARFGSFGRAQGSIQDGMRFGNWATYIALEDIHDDGYREFGTSDIRRMYADLGVRGDGSEFHINFTGADNTVGVAAASPVELLAEGWDKTFSTPQSTTNQMEMVSVNGKVKATDNWDLAGVAYYRHFNQEHVDGNISNASPCPILPSSTQTGACFQNLDGTNILLGDTNGNTIILPNDLTGLGEIDRTSVDTNSFGGSVQAVNKERLFDHHNQFLVGASIDHGNVSFQSSAELGFFQPNFVIKGGAGFVGPFGQGCDLTGSGDPGDGCTPNGTPTLSEIRPVNISTTNTYYGIFFSDTFDATDRLALTVGGRFNIADLRIHDETGLAPDLNSSPTYTHFNPMAGGTYKLVDGISVYAGYSEANRAPVPAELACADPNQPCLLPSFLTSDPPLKQVVSNTWEAGFRGENTNILAHQKLTWSLGYFRTTNNDDITEVASSIIGRSSFANAGETLRQGLEAQVNYWSGRLFTYMGYNFVDATFQNDLTLPSPFNPAADADGNIFVHPGDRIPGVPAHKFKAGFDYGLTPRWRAGADLIAASNQIFFGDASNQNAPLGGYAKVNLHTSYDVTNNIQIYGLVDNLFDRHYGVYGTFFDVEETNDSGAALGSITFTDPRTIIPAPPITAYGGIKFKFN